jgi:hypothetical protein
MVTVRREVMDDARRYIPQPISLDCLVRNVSMDSTLLIKPATKIIIVNAELHLTILV